VTRFRSLLATLLLACLATGQTSRDTSFGEWPFLVGNMDGAINQLVADSVANDLDTLYINAFRATGPLTGTLFINDASGTWNAAWGAVRPGNVGINLVTLINAARAANLQVVAVIKCFETTAPPTNTAHCQYLLDVINYLINTYDAQGRPVYDLDGISLDYVRFVSGTGNSPAPVTQFVRDVKALLGPRTLHAYLLAGRYTFDGPTYDTNFNSYTSVINGNSSQYGQHWEQMAQHVDVMMPMAYTADGSIYNTFAGHQAYVRTVASYTRQACTRAGFPARRVVPAIRCYSDTNETATAATIEASITGALAGGGDGYNAFRYGSMAGHPDWFAKLKQYSVPGQNRPVPVFTVASQGLGVALDANGCRHGTEPVATLQVRFDWENDRVWDTALSTTKNLSWIARNPGTWRIGMEVRDSTGLSGYTTRLLRAPNVLASNAPALSAAAGGNVGLILNAGPANGGRLYVLTGGLSGTSPGLPVAPGYTLPLNYDGLVLLLLNVANSPLFGNSVGFLDPAGGSLAVFSAPPGLLTGVAGQTIHFAGFALDAGFHFAFTTNAVGLLINP
jgi:hypothetical protein